jgi:ribosomal protein S18 acetylase RimI-like enzyme
MDPRYRIGMRNIKTALAVGVCLLFFQFLGVSDGITAAIAAIICMKSSLQNSVQTGIERVIGTSIGAVLGILALLVVRHIPYQLSTLLVTLSVVLIIYLCNIFKLQSTIVISLVVFLIILIGEKDLPPLFFGIMRLVETIFGIIAAYLINRFFDPSLLKRKPKEQLPVLEIRAFHIYDLPQVMALWLNSNLRLHPFIDSFFWHKNYDAIRTLYIDTANLYVYAEDDKIQGYVSIIDENEIESLFVKQTVRNNEITSQLLLYCKDQYASLTLKLYSKNEKAVEFFTKAGFSIVGQCINIANGAEQHCMEWSVKS